MVEEPVNGENVLTDSQKDDNQIDTKTYGDYTTTEYCFIQDCVPVNLKESIIR